MAGRRNLDNPDFGLTFIPFVTPSKNELDNFPTTDSSFNIGLTGDEASNFYQEVISSPTKAKNIIPKTISRVKKNSMTSTRKTLNCISSESVFRFAQEGNLKGLEQYVSEGYSVDHQDAYGWTPLMCASCEGHSKCVEFLIEKGASVLLKSRDGSTAVDIAKKTNNVVILQLLNSALRPSVEPATLNLLKCENSIQSHRHLENKTQRYCLMCKLHYKSTKAEHESGITHLLNSQKSDQSTFYHIPENNKGFQIMLKKGWDKNKGLGPNLDGRKFPIKTVLKKDRSCIGKNKEVAKVTHFSAHDFSSIKRNKPGAIQPVRERTLKKWERERINRIKNQKEIDFRRQFH